MSGKLLFSLGTFTLALNLAGFWLEPQDFRLPGDFKHPRFAASFVHTTAELQSVYAYGEDWRPNFVKGLRWIICLDCALLVISGLLFGKSLKLTVMWVLLAVAVLSGFFQDFFMWRATDHDEYARAIFLTACARYGLFGLTWIVLGHTFLGLKDLWRRQVILGLSCLAVALVISASGGVVWSWGAFLLPVVYVVASLWLAAGTLDLQEEAQALAAGAGLAYLAAGVITVFAMLFNPARIEVAFAPLLLALSLHAWSSLWEVTQASRPAQVSPELLSTKKSPNSPCQ